jgi:hypothetical protein
MQPFGRSLLPCSEAQKREAGYGNPGNQQAGRRRLGIVLID